MKKNIEIITLPPTSLEKLKENIKMNESSEINDFVFALDNLIKGESSSLLIETNENNKEQITNNEITCGELKILPFQRRVLRNDEEIFLTPKEFDILYFLIKNKGEVFTKEQIYQAVWEDTYLLDDSNIMSFIRKLRKKIEPNPDSPIYILTIWGIGYKFNDNLK